MEGLRSLGLTRDSSSFSSTCESERTDDSHRESRTGRRHSVKESFSAVEREVPLAFTQNVSSPDRVDVFPSPRMAKDSGAVPILLESSTSCLRRRFRSGSFIRPPSLPAEYVRIVIASPWHRSRALNHYSKLLTALPLGAQFSPL